MSEMLPQDPTPPPPSIQTPPSGSGSIFDPPPAPLEPAPNEQRMMGMLCHLLALSGAIGIPFGNVLGPLIIWLVKKQDMSFVDDQGKESLNFQITVIIAGFVFGVLSLIPIVGCLTIFVLLGIIIAALVFTIIAAVKANNGEYYRYPFSLRIIK